ncbi:MAG: hypothetical protein HY704_06265 [Gemmatimonadetes bacterium]|nr:hypothetical protein [Gemmatimonadota bacterium]
MKIHAAPLANMCRVRVLERVLERGYGPVRIRGLDTLDELIYESPRVAPVHA